MAALDPGQENLPSGETVCLSSFARNHSKHLKNAYIVPKTGPGDLLQHKLFGHQDTKLS
jgi:hypothetical protein